MNYKILGSIVPAVECMLHANEEMYTQSGGMMSFSGDITYKTNLKGGVGKALMRRFISESAFMTSYTAGQRGGIVTFAMTTPGTIKSIDLAGKKMICQKTAFLCAESNVLADVMITKKIRAGLFGGEGIILQLLHGQGKVFLEIAGDTISYKLDQHEKIYVNIGNIVAFSDTVDFDVSFLKKVSTLVFGGEGSFLAVLTGPGDVILQTQNRHQISANIIKEGE